MKKISSLLLGVLLAPYLVLAQSDIKIDIVIEGGMNIARPIAVVPFKWRGVADRPPHDVAAVIAADLRRSGRFNPMAYNQLPDQPTSSDEVNPELWKQRDIEAVVVGSIEETAAGQYKINYEVVDVFKPKQVLVAGELEASPDYLLLARSKLANTSNFRFSTHQVADSIYQALTGEPGAFATQIAYVSVDRSQKKPYQLFIADSDGYAPRRIFASDEAIMSPAWSPDSKSIAYVSFENGRSEVYSQEIYSGKKSLVAAFEGINSAPVFSPNGKKLALTLSKDGNPEIYILDLVTRQYRRLTRTGDFTIDTEPTWSPDGSHLLFTSDRGGRPQIYKVSANGGRAERITFDGEYNASASYTPDGKSIIVVNRTEGVYNIAIQDIQTGIMQVLTDTVLDESPSLAPNGSMVIYATIHRGRQVLAAVSTDGRFKIRLPAERGEVKAPAWSPYIK